MSTTNVLSSENKYIVCQYKDAIASFGHWMKKNPLNYALPLILLQLTVISLTSLAIGLCLGPLGQSSIVSQILGGILLGPSILSHKALLGSTLFPGRSILTLETAAAFGIMFFFFAIGVKSDATLMVRPERQAKVIGISAMLVTLLLTVSLSFLLKLYVPMDDSLASALPHIAASQGLTPFPNIACLLAELKMSSSDLGRIATSSAMLCDILGIGLVAVLLGVVQSSSHSMRSLLSISSVLLFVLTMVYIGGPVIRRVVKTIPTGRSLPEHYVLLCFAGTLVMGLISEMIGQHFVFGPLVFGLLVPDGKPLGAAIILKLDYFIGQFLYPTFLTTSGLKTDIFKIDLRSFGIVMFLVVFSCVSKIVAVVFSARFYRINFQDAVIIGLMLNARGVCELIVYNLWRDGGILTEKEFAMSVLSVVGVTAVITPLIKLLYDPRKRAAPLNRRTIQHTKRGTELRMLVCIKDQENVPSIINLLEASAATQGSPIAVIAVVLAELVSRATPMLVAHQPTRLLQPSDSRSGHIINALRQYELYNEGCVTVQSFSVISDLLTTHDDICRVALDQYATIVILPFHKHWEIDGSIGSENKAIQKMNIQVLERAPCSVGILVDRGVLNSSLSILNNHSIYRVAVIYIGGQDDAEALYYGSRMGRHHNVSLTINRFLLFGYDSARDRKQDNIIVDEVRQENIGNDNFVYEEHVVKDGVGLAASLRGLENNFDLMIVGRRHQASQIFIGLGAWSECPELGVLGDILASTDFKGTASVLVVQQQRLKEKSKFMSRMRRPPAVITHQSGHGAPATTFVVSNDYDAPLEIAIDGDNKK